MILSITSNQTQPPSSLPHPWRLQVSLLVLLVLSTLLGGCASHQPAQLDNPMTFHCPSDRLWQQSQAELKSRGFDLDKVDRRHGIIETHPRTSSQWYEFWARDVVTFQSRAEASLHTLRRHVHLEMAADADNQSHLTCRALVARQVIPPSVVSGPARANSILAGTASRMPGLTDPRREQHEQWLPLGRDLALEQDILRSLAAATTAAR